jgi:hypothetical protein
MTASVAGRRFLDVIGERPVAEWTGRSTSKVPAAPFGRLRPVESKGSRHSVRFGAGQRRTYFFDLPGCGSLSWLHRLRQQCPRYRSLAARPPTSLTGCNAADTVSSRSGRHRQQPLQDSHPDVPCPEQQSAANSASSALPSAAIKAADAETNLAESARHDRCSWSAVNHDWFGPGGRPWTEGAAQLLERGLLDIETRDAIRRLWHFGQLIGNTARHGGNLSLVPALPSLRLATVHDMLPMLNAPQRGVELPDRSLAPRLLLPAESEHWQQAAGAATGFWRRAGSENRISGGFRQTCTRNAELVSDARSPMGTTA